MIIPFLQGLHIALAEHPLFITASQSSIFAHAVFARPIGMMQSLNHH